MGNIPFTDRDHDLWFLLVQTRDVIAKARKRELGQYNISNRQSAVFASIMAIGDRATPAKIARWLFREAHSISELLSRMEKQGLVRKTKDLDKRNLVRVVLTEKGHEAYSQARKRESIHGIMSILSEPERQQLESCLQKIRDRALKELETKQ